MKRFTWIGIAGILIIGSVVAAHTDSIPGDIDRDGDVDFADFLLLAENFGKSGPVPIPFVPDTVTVVVEYGSFPGVYPGDLCMNRRFNSNCWRETENQPGCYIWDINERRSLSRSVSWQGTCVDSVGQGDGRLFWRTYIVDTAETIITQETGQLRWGRYHGEWTQRHSDRDFEIRRSYVDGRPIGKQFYRKNDGGCYILKLVYHGQVRQWILVGINPILCDW